MSLIQEALKRQQMEQEGKLPSPPAATSPKDTPLAPPPLTTGTGTVLPPPVPKPDNNFPSLSPSLSPPKPSLLHRDKSPQAEPENSQLTATVKSESSARRKYRVLPALIAVLIVLILLSGAVVWAFVTGLKFAGIHLPWSSQEVAATTAPGTTPAGVAPTVAMVPPSATPKPTPVAKTSIGSTVRATIKDANAAPANADKVATELQPITESSLETAAAPIPVALPIPSVTTAPTAVVVPAKITKSETEILARAATPAVTAAPVAPEPKNWPNLTVSGIVGNDQRGAAFINGKVIGVNESIQDVRVIAIRTHGVLLEYDGETRLIKVGQPTNRAIF